MNLDKITRKMAEALSASSDFANKNQNGEQAEEHLIYSILSQKEGMSEIIFNHLGLNLPRFIEMARRSVQKLPKISGDIIEVHPSRNLINLLKNKQDTEYTRRERETKMKKIEN